ncbi:HNH endonuclease [Pseudomonas putida]|uniref:HNH endonuclease n=1 Tax=Pseudomonas putida TaxID=303 RepID=UPI0018A95A6F|nr:HNH endonuclease [Pseudomonas putida]MBF8766024.1 HNH endonuclease [Pseudomonas putida]
MPQRPQKPCNAPGCRALTRNPRYCDEHAHLRSGWHRRGPEKGNTTERGYGHAWRLKRERILKRDDYLCRQCAQAGRVAEATEVDHIVNKAAGGSDADENLQALCEKCHKAKTAGESRAARGV